MDKILDWRQHKPLVEMEQRARGIEASRGRLEAEATQAAASVESAQAELTETEEAAFLGRVQDGVLNAARRRLQDAQTAVQAAHVALDQQARDVERAHKAIATLRVEARQAAAAALRKAYWAAVKQMDTALEQAVKASEALNSLHDLATEAYPERADGVQANAGLMRLAWRFRAMDRESLGFWRAQVRDALGE